MSDETTNADLPGAADLPDTAGADTEAALASLGNGEARSVSRPDLDSELSFETDPAPSFEAGFDLSPDIASDPTIPATDIEPQGDSAEHDAPEVDTQSPDANDPHATTEIDSIELTALLTSAQSASETIPFAPVKATTRPETTRDSGFIRQNGTFSWGSCSDVGRVRDHNEDSYVIRFPLFAVADGMGGHEAGEVASTVAVSYLGEHAPDITDDIALGASLQGANIAILEAESNGMGRPGMGCTCTAIVISGTRIAIAHAGDSRCYVLHKGHLMRLTHDHSYVEELVAAGTITPEEARIHPNRSVITRALGNDPAMQADHFLADVDQGDRILLCTDGLTSMVEDSVIEDVLVVSPSAQSCADALVENALAQGGTDNITCIVVEIKNNGSKDIIMKKRMRNFAFSVLIIAAILCLFLAGLNLVSHNIWYLTDDNGYVVLHQGIKDSPAWLDLDEIVEVSSIETALLNDATIRRLDEGILFRNEDEARMALEDYRAQALEVLSIQDDTTQVPSENEGEDEGDTGTDTDAGTSAANDETE